MPSSPVIQQTYDKFSSAYDFVFKPFLESGRAKAIELLNLSYNADVLEVGIGTGLSLNFYPPDTNLTAFDFSLGMLRESQKKTSDSTVCNTSLLQMDVQQMAFADNSFDYILSAYVLTVVEDTRKAVKEIFRVARPNARVVLINHLKSRNKYWAAVENFFHPVFSGIGLFTLDRDLVNILETCGADNIEIEPANLLHMHHIISFTTPQK